MYYFVSFCFVESNIFGLDCVIVDRHPLLYIEDLNSQYNANGFTILSWHQIPELDDKLRESLKKAGIKIYE